jgi:hypothetical protein
MLAVNSAYGRGFRRLRRRRAPRSCVSRPLLCGWPIHWR